MMVAEDTVDCTLRNGDNGQVFVLCIFPQFQISFKD
jgi:hypothetical protein